MPSTFLSNRVASARPEVCPGRQIDLARVAGDDHAAVLSPSRGEEHLHPASAGSCFCASSRKSRTAFESVRPGRMKCEPARSSISPVLQGAPLDGLRASNQVVGRARRRIGRQNTDSTLSFAHVRPGEESEPFAGFRPAGRDQDDDAIGPPCARTAAPPGQTASQVLPVPAGPGCRRPSAVAAAAPGYRPVLPPRSGGAPPPGALRRVDLLEARSGAGSAGS